MWADGGEEGGEGEGGEGSTERVALCMAFVLVEKLEVRCGGGFVPTTIGDIVEESVVWYEIVEGRRVLKCREGGIS